METREGFGGIGFGRRTARTRWGFGARLGGEMKRRPSV